MPTAKPRWRSFRPAAWRWTCATSGKDPDASLDLFARAGRLGVPTVVIGDRVFDGFGAHREEIEGLLRE